MGVSRLDALKERLGILDEKAERHGDNPVELARIAVDRKATESELAEWQGIADRNAHNTPADADAIEEQETRQERRRRQAREQQAKQDEADRKAKESKKNAPDGVEDDK